MDTESAEENLEVIRKLMERASVYRLVASYSAVIGGLFSLSLGVFFYLRSVPITSLKYFLSWMGVLLVVDCVNTFFLFKDSKKRGDSFPSRRMIHAVFAMLPGFLVGGIVSAVCIFLYRDSVNASIFWAIGAGIGLLGTSSFSPKSIPVLGWFFLLSGLLYFCWRETIGKFTATDTIGEAGLFMAATFGLGLLIYGLVSFRKEKS